MFTLHSAHDHCATPKGKTMAIINKPRVATDTSLLVFGHNRGAGYINHEVIFDGLQAGLQGHRRRAGGRFQVHRAVLQPETASQFARVHDSGRI